MRKIESNSKPNRGTFARGYNQIVTCRCCGHKTQSQIGGGTDLCQECYDFSGDYNTWQDGGCKATDLPQPVRCARCKQERAEAIAEDAENTAKGEPTKMEIENGAAVVTEIPVEPVSNTELERKARRQKGVIHYRGSRILVKDFTKVGLGWNYVIINAEHQVIPSDHIAMDTRGAAITNGKKYITNLLNIAKAAPSGAAAA